MFHKLVLAFIFKYSENLYLKLHINENVYLLDEAPPPLDTTESWTDQLAGVGLLGNKGRGMDLKYLGLKQGEFI